MNEATQYTKAEQYTNPDDQEPVLVRAVANAKQLCHIPTTLILLTATFQAERIGVSLHVLNDALRVFLVLSSPSEIAITFIRLSIVVIDFGISI
jgi:hypothetical protein